VHSGGYLGAMRGAYQYKNGVFRCGQCNIILALSKRPWRWGRPWLFPAATNPISHNPLAGDYMKGDRMDDLPGAIPVYLDAGDAVLFVDGIMHGGSSPNQHQPANAGLPSIATE